MNSDLYTIKPKAGRKAIRANTIAQTAKRRKERLTPKQQLFLKNLHKTLSENRGLEKISYGAIMKASGYSPESCDKPYQVLEAKAIKPELQNIVNKFTELRDKALNCITIDKLETENGKDLAYIADKFQKNINLLIGEATQNINNRTIKIDIKAIDQ